MRLRTGKGQGPDGTDHQERPRWHTCFHGGSYIIEECSPETQDFSSQAPEQFEGRQVDEKVDVYAFGVLMFELISGNFAWAGLDHWQVLNLDDSLKKLKFMSV